MSTRKISMKWTREDEEWVLFAWDQGMRPAFISEELDRTRESVRKKVQRLKATRAQESIQWG